MISRRLVKQALLGSVAVLIASIVYVVIDIKGKDHRQQTTTDDVIRESGYPVETHKIQTEDGYLLTVFRIPGAGTGDEGPGKRRPVWLQHGLIGSSDQFVQLGPGKALAFLLADQGYDVWLGNIRGNGYSQENVYYGTDDPRFWNFSWDEMGNYDVPAAINYVLDLTEQENLLYVGHSMGTAMLLVLLSTKPEFQSKIELAVMLAPGVFVGHTKSTILNFFCRYLGPYLQNKYGTIPLFPENFTKFQNWFWPKCYPEYVTSGFCHQLYVNTAGPTTDINPNTFPAIYSNVPSQASVKTFTHYGQGIDHGQFRAFDYGERGNLEKYGSPQSPVYNISNVNTPAVIMFSDDDYIIPPKDQYELCQSLSNVVEYYRVPLHTFNHLDFLYGWSARELVYERILHIFNNLPESLRQRASCYEVTNIH